MHIVTLKKRSDFLHIQKSEQKVATKGLVLCARFFEDRKPDENTLHVGFTVTKTVGNAVIRNRVRRRLKALAAHVMPQLASAQCHYVIIGRKAALSRDHEGLEKDFKYALHTLRKGFAQKASDAIS